MSYEAQVKGLCAVIYRRCRPSDRALNRRKVSSKDLVRLDLGQLPDLDSNQEPSG